MAEREKITSSLKRAVDCYKRLGLDIQRDGGAYIACLLLCWYILGSSDKLIKKVTECSLCPLHAFLIGGVKLAPYAFRMMLVKPDGSVWNTGNQDGHSKCFFIHIVSVLCYYNSDGVMLMSFFFCCHVCCSDTSPAAPASTATCHHLAVPPSTCHHLTTVDSITPHLSGPPSTLPAPPSTCHHLTTLASTSLHPPARFSTSQQLPSPRCTSPHLAAPCRTCQHFTALHHTWYHLVAFYSTSPHLREIFTYFTQYPHFQQLAASPCNCHHLPAPPSTSPHLPTLVSTSLHRTTLDSTSSHLPAPHHTCENFRFFYSVSIFRKCSIRFRHYWW